MAQSESPDAPAADHTDEETLRQLYVEEGLNGPEIADRFDITKQTVYRHLEKNGIDRRPPGDNEPAHEDLTDEATLRRLYVDEELTAPEIAERYGTTPESAYYWLDKHGIPRRGPDSNRGIPREDLIMDLRAGAAVLGHAPSAYEARHYGSYSPRTYYNHLGDTWPEILESAGIDPETGEVRGDLEDYVGGDEA